MNHTKPYSFPVLQNILFLEPLSILTKYKTSVTPKIDNIFLYLSTSFVNYVLYPDDDRNIVETLINIKMLSIFGVTQVCFVFRTY
jgi:hypothetical protein